MLPQPSASSSDKAELMDIGPIVNATAYTSDIQSQRP